MLLIVEIRLGECLIWRYMSPDRIENKAQSSNSHITYTLNTHVLYCYPKVTKEQKIFIPCWNRGAKTEIFINVQISALVIFRADPRISVFQPSIRVIAEAGDSNLLRFRGSAFDESSKKILRVWVKCKKNH